MFFLFRAAFWICLILLVLPVGAFKADGPSAQDRASIDTLSALAAAGATVSDLGSFCQRQPDACAVGSQALKVVGERAGVGAAMLGDYFGDKAPAAGAKPAALGAQPVRAAPAEGARDTLTAADRKPAWRAGGRQA